MLQNFPIYFVSLFICHNAKVATIAQEILSQKAEQSGEGLRVKLNETLDDMCNYYYYMMNMNK
mgnify:CR=1 FL=1